jgi:hypothetical protein
MSSYALVEVSDRVFDEVRDKLQSVGYSRVVNNDTGEIDMRGLGLKRIKVPTPGEPV